MTHPSSNSDGSDIAQKLAQEVGEVSWSYLAPHARAGNLFFVDPSLRLIDVGCALAENDSDRVQHWLKSGDLVKIEALHAAQWDDGKVEFEALVVLPFVVCRPI